MSLKNRAYDAWFAKVHGSRLIYNSCWEDPRADRELLALAPRHRVVMITSAGCNALDYLLDDPASVDCVDMNPRQNALLELKLAVLRCGDHGLLWQLFGEGWHEDFATVYPRLRPQLSATSKTYWDAQPKAFSKRGRGSFYFRGAAGDVAWLARLGMRLLRPQLARGAERLMEARTLDEQRQIYSELEPKLWTPLLRWLVRQPAMLSLVGVPRAQLALIQRQYAGGLNAFIEDKLRYVTTELPVRDNYFWRVYLHGAYSRDCCPNYLREEHFDTLRDRAERVRVHTGTLSAFLQANEGPFDRYILLDHQDWMAAHLPAALEEEWQLVIARSAPEARVLMRSASLDIDFLPEFAQARMQPLADTCAHWHQRDRVGTYGSVLCARLSPA